GSFGGSVSTGGCGVGGFGEGGLGPGEGGWGGGFGCPLSQPPGAAWPQAPQWLLSESRSAHFPPHLARPGAHPSSARDPCGSREAARAPASATPNCVRSERRERCAPRVRARLSNGCSTDTLLGLGQR